MKRGRRSAADTLVQVQFDRRPPAPETLSEDESAIWQAIVNTEAADFFATEALRGLLVDYCRHRASAEKLADVIQAFKPEWIKTSEGAKRYHGLIKMRDLETRAAADKATKLRLTNQARYTPQAAGTAAKNSAKGPRPWEL